MPRCQRDDQIAMLNVELVRRHHKPTVRLTGELSNYSLKFSGAASVGRDWCHAQGFGGSIKLSAIPWQTGMASEHDEASSRDGRRNFFNLREVCRLEQSCHTWYSQ